MKARNFLATVMVAFAISAGAATAASATTTDEATATIIVQNNNVRAVTVYAVKSDGKLAKLGWVGSTETELLEVPDALLRDGHKLQIKIVHPTRPKGGLAGSQVVTDLGIKTSPFAVEPGAVIGLWIDADLDASRVFRR